jgi:hypothetical protein
MSLDTTAAPPLPAPLPATPLISPSGRVVVALEWLGANRANGDMFPTMAQHRVTA